MPHLSELHGAATHLAVVAIPLFAILHFVAARRPRRPAVGGRRALGARRARSSASRRAGVTGLLVWGQAQTTLRGQHFRIGTAHFWLGIGRGPRGARRWRLVPVTAAGSGPPTGRSRAGAGRLSSLGLGRAGLPRRADDLPPGVGVFDGGQMAQTAHGAARAERRAGHGHVRGRGRQAGVLGRGPGLRALPRRPGPGPARPAPGRAARELEEFRRVHGHGLFPPRP